MEEFQMKGRDYMAVGSALVLSLMLVLLTTFLVPLAVLGFTAMLVRRVVDAMHGVEVANAALELRVRDRERKLLQKIREALRRIDDGSYGWCEETGEAIGLARLLARPTAALCLEAQERREQTKRRFA